MCGARKMCPASFLWEIMKNSLDLREELKKIDRRGYPAYKSLRGQYEFEDYVLSIDHVQGDPFASPSSLSVVVPMTKAQFPGEYRKEAYARTALEDALLRKFSEEIAKYSFKAKGSGKSGLISTSHPGQEILRRSAMSVSEQSVTARLEIGFPANGRTINAGELVKILYDFLPPAVEKSLFYQSWNPEELRSVYELSVDQDYIRQELPKRKLIAFLAEGSILPRVSGVSDKPMGNAVPLAVPESMLVEMDLPCHGKMRGMGIPKGVTLIIGGGYHGKSTLLVALEKGVYNHIAGDGREYAITENTALKIRAEDGRSVQNLDLSLFIHNLPNGKDTKCFSTADASGSTSQAAAVMEGIEMGSRTFLIDEDTSATNFLVRDEFMQQIVHGDKEPITPFCARVRDLYEKAGISTVLVAGSSGAFFHMADTVIQMDCYRPRDVRDKVEQYLPNYPLPRFEVEEFDLIKENRAFWGRGLRRDERIKTKVTGTDGFSVNRETVDLRYVEQLVDHEQTAALAAMMKYVLTHLSGAPSVERLAKTLKNLAEQKGLKAFMDGYAYCGMAEPRIQEIYAMLNRYRGK